MRTAPSSGGSSAPGAPAHRHAPLQLARQRAEILERPVLLRAAGERMDHGEVLALHVAADARDSIARAIGDRAHLLAGRNRWRATPQPSGGSAGKKREWKLEARGPTRETRAGSRRTTTRWSRIRAVLPAGARAAPSRPADRAPWMRWSARDPRIAPAAHSARRPKPPGIRLRRHSSAGSETMKSPMAPGRITSLRTSVPVSQKQKCPGFDLSTEDPLRPHCNQFETKEINIEEKGRWRSQKRLTKNRCEGILGEVPRGLRNSKPPET